MNGVLNALASLALLAFTVKLAETAIVNNTAGGVSGAGGAGAKTRSAATPASNNFGAELSANNPPTAHRPGWTIKKALSKELPLHNGTSTDKASILDLYKTYQQLIKQENAQRYKQYRTHRYSLKGMTLSSFKSL